MISLAEKLWEIYRESRSTCLNVSLTVSIRNGADMRLPIRAHGATGAPVLNDHGRLPRGICHERRGGQREQHGRHGGLAQQAQNSNATSKPSYAAVVRSPPSPLRPRLTKRAKRPFRGVM